MRSISTRFRWLGVLLVVALLAAFAACAGDSESPASPTAPAGTPTPAASPVRTAVSGSPTPFPTFTPPPPTPTPTPEVFGGGREPVEKVVKVPSGALLVDVRTEQYPGYDRITLEFKNGLPGYRVEYVNPPITKDPSDLPVELQGTAFLRIHVDKAAAHDDDGKPTYKGSQELFPALPVLLEAEQIGDFEGVLTWVLGLSAKVDFRVVDAREPFRISVDVQH